MARTAAHDTLALEPERAGDVPGASSGRGMAHAIAAAPVTVVYIAGYGRSGTTLLDISLGAAEDVASCGELATLARHVWHEGEFCACGETVRDCAQWRDIVADWMPGDSDSGLAELARLQRPREAMISPARWSDRHVPGRSSERFARVTGDLYRRIAARTGKSIVIDSSKLPGRGLALADMPGIALYVVHMTRDARGVVWSLRKPHKIDKEAGVQRELRPKPLLYAAARWALVNRAAEALAQKVGPDRSMRVRYEDFVADPQGTVRAILTMVRGRPSRDPVLDAQGRVFPGHQMAGSRHRMAPSIRFRADESWKRDMPARERRIVTAATRPMLAAYGYI
ncbi:sulfotransferase family protein [Aurantiacibacter spongiae]|uniref:Sulfotransferase n=1 Tax=Aurantiacibacter spongiae TaxID=2488860 RepID=A0A3N5CUQ7_9SPHN|nr:sulfotransferase [Aurantiacibacter spongiae]RPF71180.1 sulfotransferase [Aurantiacibacter spongiae]